MRSLRTTTIVAAVAFGAALAAVAPAMAHGRADSGVVSGYQSYSAPAYAQMYRADRNSFDRNFGREQHFDRHEDSRRGRVDMRRSDFRGADWGQHRD